MGKHRAGLSALLIVLGLAGCSSSVPDVEPAAKVEPEPRLGEKADVEVGEWLKLPRKDLAKLSDEWAETVATQRKAIHSTPTSVELLPKFLPPFQVPGLDQATFSEAAGFSLPSYAAPGKPDSALALHLARMGDREAAAKLVDPADEATLAKYDKNYPIEWTRLVGLVLISSHLKLSTGDIDGATNLVHVHQQLLAALDPKATAGPLGAALLPWGRRALLAASEAYRGPKRNKKDLADDIDKALAAWGAVPASAPALVPGASRAQVLAVLGRVAQGNSVVCSTPDAVARALDVLTMPLPAEGVQSIVAFLEADKLTEFQIAYQPKIDTLYPTPASVAYPLLERQATRGDLKIQTLQQEVFTLGGLRYEVTRSDRSLSVGGLVRVVSDKHQIAPYEGQSLTQFGPVDLRRGYESNRVHVALRRGGSSVTIEDAVTLKKLSKPHSLPTPARAVLTCEKDRDLVKGFQLGWTADDNAAALQRLLPPLWAAFGPSAMADSDEGDAAYLSFTWRNGDNEVQLRLPYNDHPPTLVARDLRSPEKQAARLAEARAADAWERQARFAVGKPEERLPRSAGIANELSLMGLRLGQDRAAALAALPKGKDYSQGKGDRWASVALLTAPTATATIWLRQIQLRFGEDDKLTEMRLRYQTGPTASRKGQTMLDQLSDAKAGAPETIAPQWAGLWADLSEPGKTASYRWSDDRTIRLYSEDAGGMEVILRDRSDKEPRPWQWLGTGVGRMRLGETADAIEDGGRNTVLTTSDGASVYRGPKDGPYEMVLVWYASGDKARATRVVAVHRDIPPSEPKEVAAALNRVWGKDIGTLGFLRHQVSASGAQLGAYFWNDDRVRVKTWAEATDKGPRLRTEWRYWPLGDKVTR
jgi:hypothetical protein